MGGFLERFGDTQIERESLEEFNDLLNEHTFQLGPVVEMEIFIGIRMDML